MEASGSPLSHRPETLAFHQTAVAKAIQLMRHDPAATLDWNTLCQTARMSRFHFLRVFEEQTQITPHRFLVALRVEMARRLLVETKSPVNEVCSRVGYTSVGSFIRVFKELVGLSPGEFRQFAVQLDTTRARGLLALHLKRRHHQTGSVPVHAHLQFTQPFAGTIFFWLYQSPLRPIAPVTVLRVRESGFCPVHLNLPEIHESAFLLAVAFPDDNWAHRFLLPDRNIQIAISQPLSPSSSLPGGEKIAMLNVRLPSVFDPPILVCLPLFLHQLAGDVH